MAIAEESVALDLDEGVELSKRHQAKKTTTSGSDGGRIRPTSAHNFRVKIDLPNFNGHLHVENFLDWILKVENFFDYM